MVCASAPSASIEGDCHHDYQGHYFPQLKDLRVDGSAGKVTDAKPDDLSLILGTHMVERELAAASCPLASMLPSTSIYLHRK